MNALDHALREALVSAYPEITQARAHRLPRAHPRLRPRVGRHHPRAHRDRRRHHLLGDRRRRGEHRRGLVGGAGRRRHLRPAPPGRHPR
nr:hypothetical protein [Angustibacter aerolatus]